MELSEKAEEAAGFFAKMLDHDYTKKDIFCNNFFQDWRKVCIQTVTISYMHTERLIVYMLFKHSNGMYHDAFSIGNDT